MRVANAAALLGIKPNYLFVGMPMKPVKQESALCVVSSARSHRHADELNTARELARSLNARRGAATRPPTFPPTPIRPTTFYVIPTAQTKSRSATESNSRASARIRLHSSPFSAHRSLWLLWPDVHFRFDGQHKKRTFLINYLIRPPIRLGYSKN